MKDRILDLHLYLSLLCAPYLVLYGLSTLSFNHTWGWISPGEQTYRWQEDVGRLEGDTDLVVATGMRDSLGLIGFVPPWQIRNAGESLRFIVGRPGKRYEIAWSAETDTASVVETRSGFWGVMRDLHGLMEIQGSPLGWMWKIYTWTSVAALTFALVSGLYLWWNRLPARKSGLWLLLFGSGGTLLFMLFIVW